MNQSGFAQAALQSLSGVQNMEPTIHEVRLYFTQAPWAGFVWAMETNE